MLRDPAGTSVDCSAREAAGQDGAVQAGVPWPTPRFTDHGDGTVTDHLTGLIWLKNANCFGPQTWSNALSAANTLAHGSCGLSDGSAAGDWRLSNVKELQSLIDFGQISPALATGHPFSDVFLSSSYWSSTTGAGAPSPCGPLDVNSGGTSRTPKGSIMFVWPVRGPNSGAWRTDAPSPRHDRLCWLSRGGYPPTPWEGVSVGDCIRSLWALNVMGKTTFFRLTQQSHDILYSDGE